ncbi:hypothetical protein AOLI_G00265870 [Acnodon oligacanthus]
MQQHGLSVFTRLRHGGAAVISLVTHLHGPSLRSPRREGDSCARWRRVLHSQSPAPAYPTPAKNHTLSTISSLSQARVQGEARSP